MRLDTDLVLEQATARCPSSFWLLADIDEPLGDYARRIYTFDERPENPLSLRSRALFAEAVAKRSARDLGHLGHLGDLGHLGGGDRLGLDEAWTVPVVQTGPHHRFAFDDDYFSTLAFSVLGSAAAGSRLNVMFNCATITLEERVRRGPAWLRTNAEPTRAFDIPRRTLSKKSVISFDTPVQVSTELIERLNGLSAHTGIPLDMASIASRRRAVRDHIAAVNEQVFEQFRRSYGVHTVALDESFFTSILIDTLESDSLLSRIFADGRIHRVIELLGELAGTSVRRFIPNSTDLFWANIAEKVRPLRLAEDRLYSDRYEFSVRFDIPSLVAALRNGLLIPNLFLVFCLASIIPLVRAVGGSYQAVYYEAFAHVVAAILDEKRPDERLLKRELEQASLVAWGHNLISRNAMDYLLPGGNGQGVRFSTELPQLSIAEVSDELSAFTCDDLWAELCQ